MERRALVTGATGFIGANLVNRLVEEGWTVHVIVRPSSNLKRLNGAATVHEYDGTLKCMFSVFSRALPDYVFHLSSLFVSEHRGSDIEPLMSSNLIFGTNLLEAMKEFDIKNLVNTGTSWQHYRGKLYSPVNLYAATKQAFEAIIEYYVETSSLNVITLKLFDTYGPDDPRRKLISLLFEASLTGKQLEMSLGEQMLDLVYVDDVVGGYICAAKMLDEGQIDGHMDFGLTSGDPIRLRDLLKRIEYVIGRKLVVNFGARPYRDREVMVPWRPTRLLPGWVAKTALDDGLRMTFVENQ